MLSYYNETRNFNPDIVPGGTEMYSSRRIAGEPSTSPSEDPRRVGRSHFTPQELSALDNPQLSELQQQNYPHNVTLREAVNIRETVDPDNTTSPNTPTRGHKILGVFLTIIPPGCLTAAAYFVHGIRTDFKLFGATFSVFQGMFWPGLLFFLIEMASGKWNPQQSSQADRSTTFTTRCANIFFTNGKWKLTLLFLFHGLLSAISLLAFLFSLQRLNISVALALSFGSVIYVVLIKCINREKTFSLEMIVFSVMGYMGFIVAELPAMLPGKSKSTEASVTGLIASLTCMGCGIPATFIFTFLRENKVLDSLMMVSTAFHGSLYTLAIIMVAGYSDLLHEDLVQDKMTLAWASGLISLVVFGTIFTFINGWYQNTYLCTNTSHDLENVRFGVAKTRLLVFLCSCLVELIRQSVRNSFPDPYDIIGSVLVFTAYLLSTAYDKWSVRPNDLEGINPKKRFELIPWLFSRTIQTNYFKTTSGRYN